MARDKTKTKGSKAPKNVPLYKRAWSAANAPVSIALIYVILGPLAAGGITAAAAWLYGRDDALAITDVDPPAVATENIDLAAHIAGLGPGETVWAFNEPNPTDDPAKPNEVYPGPGPCVVSEGGDFTCSGFDPGNDVEKYRFWFTVLDSEEALLATSRLHHCDNGACSYKDAGVPDDLLDPVSTNIILVRPGQVANID